MKILLLLGILLLACPAPAKTWTTLSGNTLDAEFVKLEDKTVFLKRNDNGETVSIPKNKLCPADADFALMMSLDIADVRTRILRMVEQFETKPFVFDSDKKAAELLVDAFRPWLDSYKSDTVETRQAYMSAYEKAKYVYQKKPITGTEYNSFLHEVVEVPITYTVLENYAFVSVGEDPLSTLTTMGNFEEFGKLPEKFRQWEKICRADKMNVQKDAGAFGGISITFVSENEGTEFYYIFSARGDIGENHICESKTVILNPLNMTTFFQHVATTTDQMNKNEENRRNADKLN